MHHIHGATKKKLKQVIADLERHIDTFEAGKATDLQECKANHLVERIEWYTLVHLSPIHGKGE